MKDDNTQFFKAVRIKWHLSDGLISVTKKLRFSFFSFPFHHDNILSQTNYFYPPKPKESISKNTQVDPHLFIIVFVKKRETAHQNHFWKGSDGLFCSIHYTFSKHSLFFISTFIALHFHLPVMLTIV